MIPVISMISDDFHFISDEADGQDDVIIDADGEDDAADAAAAEFE